MHLEIEIVEAENAAHITGDKGSLSDGEWAIVMVDYLRQITCMLTHAFPGQHPDKMDCFGLLCDFVRKKFMAPAMLTETRGLRIVEINRLPDDTIQFRTLKVQMPLEGWAQTVIDLNHHVGLKNHETFKQFFDMEVAEPSGQVKLHHMKKVELPESV